jgi:hypothetical protein
MKTKTATTETAEARKTRITAAVEAAAAIDHEAAGQKAVEWIKNMQAANRGKITGQNCK